MGKPRPQHVKDKISRSQQERYRKARRQPYPPKKRCSRCGIVKDSPRDFGWTKRILVSGEVVYHPRSWCKECQREKSRAYRDKLRREGRLDKKQKEWNASRKKRRYRSPDQTKFPGEHNDTLPIGPMRTWLKGQLERAGYPDPCPDELRRRIDAIVAQEYATTGLASIDAILLSYGKPELLDELYPLPDQG